MRLGSRRVRAVVLATVAGLGVPLFATLGAGGADARSTATSDDARFLPYSASKNLMHPHENEGKGFQQARDAYYASRIYSGTRPLSVERVAALHERGAAQALALANRSRTTSSFSRAYAAPTTVTGLPSWSSIGPVSTLQVGRTTGTLETVSGRISAMAIDHSGRIYAGAAGGGLWRYDPGTATWTVLTDALPTLAVGAVAIDPSNDNTIYLGTGEGDLSGDSHFGDGIWKSTNGGTTWTHLGSLGNGAYMFDQATISRLLAVRTGGTTTLYVATIRGRGGERRVSPPTNQVWGVYRSMDAGAHWQLLKGTTEASHGATDLEVDPYNHNVLYASFWGDGIYKTVTPVARTLTPHPTWQRIMSGLPNGLYAAAGTRFAIATVANQGRTRLYAGFDYYDSAGNYHQSQLWRSDSAGMSWKRLPTTGENGPIDSVLNYCDIQCTYDNVVEADPSNPNIVYAAGEYNYGLASGGIYRSVDGGMTWQSLGYDLHPDFHAFAFDPSDPQHIAIGNDGGVWQSADRGGRPFAHGDISQVDWQNLNTGLTITQFDSIDYADPTHPNRFWGGTQDNGTQRKSSGSNTWFDIPGGDGGQVLVDHNDTNPNTNWTFGEYYGISPYRVEGAGLFFGDIASISTGINTNDRSEFYAPWVMNQANGNQLFYGTYRVYRTDNAETPSAADVRWKAISPDLTSGCTGPAPNGGRNCTITAVGHSEGANALWVGTQEGYVWVAPDAGTSDTPHWVRVDTNGPNGALANRPVTSIAVDRSNWRIAYVSYAGFNAADPGHTGHIFKTTDGGQTWTNVSGDLPEGPVNSLVLNPSTGKLMAGTDFGAFVADVSGGSPSWTPVGSALPAVQVWQLAYDSSRGLLVAGTHGRGAWKLDTGTTAPALVATTADSGKPVGPGTDIDYTITVKNEGNAAATGVTITQPVPANTTYVNGSADNGGSLSGGNVVWSGITIPAGGSASVHYSATIDPSLPSSVTEIVSDGLTATDGTVSTTGSPFTTPIAPPHAVSVSPQPPVLSGDPGSDVHYQFTVTNDGYQSDTFNVAASGGYSTSIYQSDCSTPATDTGLLQRGDSASLCAVVTIPPSVPAGDRGTETLTATSQADNTVTDSADIVTVPASSDTLLVDEDGSKSGGGAPDAQGTYVDALTTAGHTPDVWDVTNDGTLTQAFLDAHKNVYWETGVSYPDPLGRYEDMLKSYLDAGNSLFVSGQDILDQAAGTAPFVHDYLHITWDGSETQNDKATADVTGINGTPIGDGLGAIALNQPPAYQQFEDEITPNNGAQAQFQDDASQPDGLAVTDSTTGPNTFKVVFLSFPFENLGTASDRATIIGRVASYFGP